MWLYSGHNGTCMKFVGHYVDSSSVVACTVSVLIREQCYSFTTFSCQSMLHRLAVIAS